MNETELAVTVAVRRPDGSIEHIRVGTALREGNELRLRLDELRIGGVPAQASTGGSSPAWGMAMPTPGPAVTSGAVFPNYGRSKGRPVAGASRGDLEFYANGCRRTLNDPSKVRWHEKERALLAAIEAEIARQQGGATPPSSRTAATPPDDNIPPPEMNFGPPADEDDDIPF